MQDNEEVHPGGLGPNHHIVFDIVVQTLGVPRELVTPELPLGHQIHTVLVEVGKRGLGKKPLMGCTTMTVGDVLEFV